MAASLSSRDLADPPARAKPRRPVAPLPAGPFTWLFALFPLWWLLGLADVATIVVAVVMLLHLVLRPGLRVPRGFVLWLLFLALMLCSALGVTRGIAALTFGYRAAIYLASTVVLVYVYNARESLDDRRVLRHLAVYWGTTVVGGFLGLLAPTAAFRTPAYYVVQQLFPSLLNNSLVDAMVIRRFAQYTPNGYFHVAPRPSAPFLYTNNWGNAYSLLLPLVLVLLTRTAKGSLARLLLLVGLPLSVVPALLTLNRGMFLGLAIAAVYAAVSFAWRREFRPLAGLAVLGIIGAVLFTVLPVQQRLDTRVQASTTTRASLYQQSLDVVRGSPVLGVGVPASSTNAADPPVGTQGQVWMVLVSHGVPATACFMGFFGLMFLRSRRRRDALAVACSAVLLISVVELLYYGVLPYGLPLMMTVAALAVRRTR